MAIAYKDVLNHKGRLKLLNVPVHIRKTLCMVGLDRALEIYEDEDFALRSFEEDRIISEIQKKQLRRRFKRIDLDIDLEFKPCGKNEPFHHAKLLNLSAVGMLIFADKAYPLGEILDVRLSLLPKPGLLEAQAKVVWLVQKEIQPQIYPGMGLEFHNLDSSAQKKIVEFVDRNLPLSCSTD
jgi:Tfp pilus assembly protein PilZ